VAEKWMNFEAGPWSSIPRAPVSVLAASHNLVKHRHQFDAGTRYHFYNVPSALDADNEWYHDAGIKMNLFFGFVECTEVRR
jgi:hypothetical protein